MTVRTERTRDYISDLLSKNGSKLLQLYGNYIPSHALDSIFVKQRKEKREREKKPHVASPKVQAKQCGDRYLQILGGQIEILNSSVLLTDSKKVVTSIARRVHVKCKKKKKNYLQTYICTCISIAKRLNHSRVI